VQKTNDRARHLPGKRVFWNKLHWAEFVLSQHGSGMVFVVEQDPVGALGSDAADEAFGERVRERCPGRVLNTSMPSALKDRVE
jgi:hypothetical protein